MAQITDARSIDADTVAGILGVSRNTVYNLTRRAADPLPAFHIGRRITFEYAEVRNWKNRQSAK